MARGILKDDPSQADHRFIGYLVDTFFGDQNVLHDPDSYDRIGDVFEKMNGSWQRLFKGSVKDLVLLRTIVRVAIKRGYIKKEPQFR